MAGIKIFLKCISLCLVTYHAFATLEEEVALCPCAPDFTPFFQKIPNLGRRLRVASPCVGVHSCGHAMKTMGVLADSINVYDLDQGYSKAILQGLLDAGMEMMDIQLNLGKKIGDVTKKSVLALQKPVDLLIAGPPCPPWAGQGNKQGLRDIRAKVFLKILEWLIFFIKGCGLLCVILENVLGITYEYD